MVDDEATLRFGPSDPSGSGQSRIFPALTIIWHPNLDRVGQIAPLAKPLLESGIVHLSRAEPDFLVPGQDEGQPLVHLGIGRRGSPALDILFEGGVLELRRRDPQIDITVNLERLVGGRELSREEVDAGVIITVGLHFAFCFHLVHSSISRSSVAGLLGTSEAIEDVRRSILRVAGKNMPVLLRGESGTGKELAARALHEAGPRAKGPFVVINMATLVAERAAADLFGHRKGAFTGATADVPGHFRSAAGGTIFLDEIGYLAPDVQPMLLRVLDNQEILPLGTSQPVKVDVRVVTATDRDLEKWVKEKKLEEPLYNRLKTALTIPLAPLRKRREDVGCLLVHFLRQEKEDQASLQELLDSRPVSRPWLSNRDLAAVALSPLPRNARSLLELARKLLDEASDPPHETHSVVKEFLLDGDSSESPKVGASGPRIISKGETDLTNEQIMAAMEKAKGSYRAAALELGMDHVTLWNRVQRDPELKRLVHARWPGRQRKS